VKYNKKNKYKDLYAENCEVLDLYRNKAVVKLSEKENLIVKKIGNIKKGDKVEVFVKPTLSRVEEILIYISPAYYLFLGLVFGFLLGNDLYHYLLILGMTLLGFVQLFALRLLIKKVPETSYVAINKEN
jgi:positive regulator of sigma E activity